MATGNNEGRDHSNGCPAGSHCRDTPHDQDRSAGDSGEPTDASTSSATGSGVTTTTVDGPPCPITFAPQKLATDKYVRFKFRSDSIPATPILADQVLLLRDFTGMDLSRGRFTVTDSTNVSFGTGFELFRDHLSSTASTEHPSTSSDRAEAVFIAPSQIKSIAGVAFAVTPSQRALQVQGGAVLFSDDGSYRPSDFIEGAARKDGLSVTEPISWRTTSVEVKPGVRRWLTAHLRDLQHHSTLNVEDNEVLVPNPYYRRPEQLLRDLGVSSSLPHVSESEKCQALTSMKTVCLHLDDDVIHSEAVEASSTGHFEPAVEFRLTNLSRILPSSDAVNVALTIRSDALRGVSLPSEKRKSAQE